VYLLLFIVRSLQITDVSTSADNAVACAADDKDARTSAVDEVSTVHEVSSSAIDEVQLIGIIREFFLEDDVLTECIESEAISMNLKDN